MTGDRTLARTCPFSHGAHDDDAGDGRARMGLRRRPRPCSMRTTMTLNLYFLSEERTQHGQNMLANPQVAATIQADGQDWRAIRGVQVRGTASLVAAGELAHTAAVYGRKYAFVGGTAGRQRAARACWTAHWRGAVLGAAAAGFGWSTIRCGSGTEKSWCRDEGTRYAIRENRMIVWAFFCTRACSWRSRAVTRPPGEHLLTEPLAAASSSASRAARPLSAKSAKEASAPK